MNEGNLVDMSPVLAPAFVDLSNAAIHINTVCSSLIDLVRDLPRLTHVKLYSSDGNQLTRALLEHRDDAAWGLCCWGSVFEVDVSDFRCIYTHP